MPTTKPRYTVTETGEMRKMLDLAGKRWPEIEDRRQLLLRLVSAGAELIASELDAADAEARRRRQRQALGRAHEVMDTKRLLSDPAWH